MKAIPAVLFSLAVFLGPFLAGGWHSSALASSLESLEETASKAPTLRAFLANTALKREYFEELRAYYGADKINKRAFDAVIRQLKDLIGESPELAERLWQVREARTAVHIENQIPVNGVEIKTEAWEAYLGDLERNLRETAGPLLGIGEDASSARLNILAANISQEIARFEEAAANLPRSEKNERSRQLYQERIPNLPDFKAASALLALKWIFNEGHRQVWQSGDADLILYSWSQLKNVETGLFPYVELEDVVADVLLRPHLQPLALPDLKIENGVPTESQLFRTILRATRNGYAPIGRLNRIIYEFKIAARKFHSLWKGVHLGECVGGNRQSLDRLTPQRWAVEALEGAVDYHLQKNGAYVGFLQTVPFRLHGKDYHSVDYGAVDLAHDVFVDLSNGAQKMKLFEAWLHSSSSQSYVVGQSKAVNNAGVKGPLMRSRGYLFGESVGEAANLKLHDPMSAVIVDYAKRKGAHSAYAKGMIFDAGVVKVGTLRRLVDPWEPATWRAAVRNFLNQTIELGENLSVSERLQELKNIGISQEMTEELLDFLKTRRLRPALYSSAVYVLASLCLDQPAAVDFLLENSGSGPVEKGMSRFIGDVNLRGEAPQLNPDIQSRIWAKFDHLPPKAQQTWMAVLQRQDSPAIGADAFLARQLDNANVFWSASIALSRLSTIPFSLKSQILRHHGNSPHFLGIALQNVRGASPKDCQKLLAPGS